MIYRNLYKIHKRCKTVQSSKFHCEYLTYLSTSTAQKTAYHSHVYCTISTYSFPFVTCDCQEEMSISLVPKMRCDNMDISSPAKVWLEQPPHRRQANLLFISSVTAVTCDWRVGQNSTVPLYVQATPSEPHNGRLKGSGQETLQIVTEVWLVLPWLMTNIFEICNSMRNKNGKIT
jgi:hypothetical protein